MTVPICDIVALVLFVLADIVALVLFVLAAIGAPVPRFNLIAGGLAFLTVAMMVSGGVLHG